MPTMVNLPTKGVATAPKLSKRALDALKKGAKVELWVEPDPFTIQIGDLKQVEKQVILCSLHTALMKHFSGRWKRELSTNIAKRLAVPFAKEPVRLVVAWMTGGGGIKLGTPEVPYPRKDLRRLEILKDLATYLKMNLLVELIAKDMVAVTPITPRLPKASLVSNPIKNKATEVGRLCWHCHKSGHVKRDCRERNAVHVTLSHAETFALNGTRPVAETSDSKTLKLEPVSGEIVAVDHIGTKYLLGWSKIDIEVDGPATAGILKIIGFASVAP